ncbi:MAG TPA: hypothetical protein VF297_10570 [Pyrinomonadaceae bacterium]
MDWLQAIVGGLISTSTVIAVTVFVSREWFTRLINRGFERFKHDLQIEAMTRELTLKSQIEFKERQLSEFYGPIYSRLKRGRALVRLWKDGKLAEINQQFWELARKTNTEIEDIILTKSHLIDGDEIPKSFIQFLTHVPIWHGFMETSHGSVPFSQEDFPEAYYTEEFEKDIYSTTEKLKKDLKMLYLRFGVIESVGSSVLAEQ